VAIKEYKKPNPPGCYENRRVFDERIGFKCARSTKQRHIGYFAEHPLIRNTNNEPDSRLLFHLSQVSS